MAGQTLFLKCKTCKSAVGYKSNLQKKRNNNFYCSRSCYLSFVRREKIVNYDFFNNIDTEEKVYWAGFIYADGTISKKTNCLQINLSSIDSHHLQKFANIFKKQVNETNYYNKGKGKLYAGCSLSLSSARLKKSLTDIGICSSKSFDDGSIIFNFIEDKFLHHFIRGFFDGDGSVGFSVGNFSVSFAGEYGFLIKLREILISKLGLGEIILENRDKIHVLRWSGREQLSIIGNFLYKDASIYLERKEVIFNKYKKNINNRGSSCYRGVSWHKDNQKWLASISHNKKRINLGYYEEETEAAKAYDMAVLRYDKPKRKLNFLLEQRR